MALSPNYGWSEPDNTDLVKNGAQAMRTLGDAIDTSLWNVGFGQAGKNKIINGDFRVNQRAFSSTTTPTTYTFDRWVTAFVDGTNTASAQTFTPGTAPTTGYEAKNFIQLTSTGQTATNSLTAIMQKIESARTFANQTVTISFWAKASSGTPYIVIWGQQLFGSGGSPSSAVNFNLGNKFSISTTWTRYTRTVTIPSVSGKTFGTTDDGSLNILLTTSAGTDRNSYTDSLGIQSITVDFWGVQVEAGSKATPFQTATGTIQGELAACQRYYWRSTGTGTQSVAAGNAASTTASQFTVINPVAMRVNPTSIEYASLALADGNNALVAATAVTISSSGTLSSAIAVTVASGLTQYRPYSLTQNSSSAGYIAFNAEL